MDDCQVVNTPQSNKLVVKPPKGSHLSNKTGAKTWTWLSLVKGVRQKLFIFLIFSPWIRSISLNDLSNRKKYLVYTRILGKKGPLCQKLTN